MPSSYIAGVGMYVPKNVVRNDDLSKYMDTTDEWIQERTGIKERRFADRTGETTTTMAIEASKMALDRAGLTPLEVDFIIFATLSPDYYVPGCGVLLQRALKMKEIGALDVRNQCSGFIYALSIADQFIKTGMYKNILVVGSEKHSFNLDISAKGRNLSVLFGDGAGAVVVGATDEPGRGILSSHLHSDGDHAESLAIFNPGSHANYWKEGLAHYDDAELSRMYVSHRMIDDEQFYAHMDGLAVVTKAVSKFCEVIMEALNAHNLKPENIDLLVPHQANLRISEFIQKKFKLRDSQLYNNIQRYGNTTAASIPIALCEAWQEKRIKKGDIICLAAFGSGFTWGSVLLKW
jgi:3-oxoacyl-[acyl-carrier-protein] synthase III